MLEECWQVFRHESLIAIAIVYALVFLARVPIKAALEGGFNTLALPFRYFAVVLKRSGSIATRRYVDLHSVYAKDVHEEDHTEALKKRQTAILQNADAPPIRMYNINVVVQKMEDVVDEVRSNIHGPKFENDATGDDGRVKIEKLRALRTYRSALKKLPSLTESIASLRRVIGEDSERLKELESANEELRKALLNSSVTSDPDLDASPVKRSLIKPLATSGLLATLGVALALFNALMITGPITVLLGREREIMGLDLAYPGALVFILGEVIAGILALEWFGITQWGVLKLRGITRTVMAFVALGLLVACAYAEVSLVGLRSSLAESRESIRNELNMAQNFDAGSVIDAIPTLEGQIILAFVLPFLTTLGFSQMDKFAPVARVLMQQLYSWALQFSSGIFALIHAVVCKIRDVFVFIFNAIFVVVPEKILAAVVWLSRLIGKFLLLLFRRGRTAT